MSKSLGGGARRRVHLKCDQFAINLNFLGQEISPDGGLILSAVLLVYISVHQRGLAHAKKTKLLDLRCIVGRNRNVPAVPKQDDLQKSPSLRHFVSDLALQKRRLVLLANPTRSYIL
jgi:hypothetical protein